jgi:hypothetical protein
MSDRCVGDHASSRMNSYGASGARIIREALRPVHRLVSKRHLEEPERHVVAEKLYECSGGLATISVDDVVEYRQTEDEVEVSVGNQG